MTNLNRVMIQPERCIGSGDCVPAYIGGICPVSRSAKRLFNGPCGGSSQGKCEIDETVDCAWQLIINRLTALGKLRIMKKSIRRRIGQPAVPKIHASLSMETEFNPRFSIKLLLYFVVFYHAEIDDR